MKERINRIISMVQEPEFRILPGNLAYSFFLAIIPILTITFYLLTYFNLKVEEIENLLQVTFSTKLVSFFQPVFTGTITLNSVITLVISIIVITNGCNAIIIASDTIYNFEVSSLFKRLVKSLILSIILIILFGFMILVPLLGRTIIDFVSSLFNFAQYKQFLDTVYLILQIPVSMLVIFIIIKIIYLIAPDDKVLSKYVNKGALFTTVMWVIITTIYSYYISNIAKYDMVYGNLANIVVLLFWFYILAFIFVMGLYISKLSSERGIERTNSIKLEEIRKKIKEQKK